MVNKLIRGAFGAAAAFVLFVADAEASVITITPTTAQQWTMGANSNPSEADLEQVIGLAAGTLVVSGGYKSEVANPPNPNGEGVDLWQFANSYDTIFSMTATDPENATITWITGQPFISFTDMYLVIKDGKQNPSVYIFNLNKLDLDANGSFESHWNGTDTIQITGFWPDQGAISNVQIVRGSNPQITLIPNLPEPTSLAIWALGMVAAGFGARRLRKAR